MFAERWPHASARTRIHLRFASGLVTQSLGALRICQGNKVSLNTDGFTMIQFPSFVVLIDASMHGGMECTVEPLSATRREQHMSGLQLFMS